MSFEEGVHDDRSAIINEWLESLDAVIDEHGRDWAESLVEAISNKAKSREIDLPPSISTSYRNTIPVSDEPQYPGDLELEARIRAFTRWNAAAMIVRVNQKNEGIGGHLSTFASTATLYDVGWNHFFHGKDGELRDFVYFQPHASPGIYARAYLEGRLDEDRLDGFRRELSTNGLPALPHPKLMPDFWEFPTGSMGIGPINAIYQARFNRYLHNRGLADTDGSHVWMFMGDGEADEPESIGALSVAGRERLDNLTFVVNCNLQRLDGPVRGNGKIIQELESVFLGAGWNVIKVLWGSAWDDLFARDHEGLLQSKLNAMTDGEYQKFSVESGEYIRKTFFEPDPRLAKLVEHLSDAELEYLPRGGHDSKKVHAAYKQALEHKGQPTVILAQTVKGWALGPEIEARNATHQIKKMNREQLRGLRDRLRLQDFITDKALEADVPPYFRPAQNSPEHEYLMRRRQELGGFVPSRTVNPKPFELPSQDAFAEFANGSNGRPVSTTMAFVGLLRNLLRDKQVGAHIVPIVPDEARTFGMDSLFSEVKIYAPFGQLYEPVDAHLMLSYLESAQGQILEEGITEAGALGSFTAASTSHITQGVYTIPFFVFYSMFGFQRVGDLIWAVGDSGGKGFLLGATAGRTTLNGEGLQHQDGHSPLLASTVPNLRVYDPAFAYETAVIIKDGIETMYGANPQDCFYYLTIYNENYAMPQMPGPVTDGIVRGIYQYSQSSNPDCSRRANILFSGPASQAALKAQQLLAEHHDVDATTFSVTSYKALREEALDVDRWNMLHPQSPSRVPYVTSALKSHDGPFVAVTDYMKSVPDQIARWIPGHYEILGTDGYGRSDTRPALRHYFEVDAGYIVVAVLRSLVLTGEAKNEEVIDAIEMYGIDPEAPNPASF